MSSLQGRGHPWRLTGWYRTLEWALAAAVVAVLVAVFMRHMRIVQGQSEQAAIRTTLGALRTAFVIDHLQRSVETSASLPVAKEPLNPFHLLQYRPLNYAGTVDSRKTFSVPPGSWVFDPVCPCVGYRPLDGHWLNIPSGDTVAWYQISGAPGPLQLTARENYRWQDQMLD